MMISYGIYKAVEHVKNKKNKKNSEAGKENEREGGGEHRPRASIDPLVHRRPSQGSFHESNEHGYKHEYAATARPDGQHPQQQKAPTAAGYTTGQTVGVIQRRASQSSMHKSPFEDEYEAADVDGKGRSEVHPAYRGMGGS